jgi:putative peptidoglycan binding protein
VTAPFELYYVPNYPNSLLIIVSLLLSVGRLYSDDRIRQAQEELRKRHLFFGETTGQPSPALTAALGHYQKKKGFPCTGRLDPETSASLGVVKVVTAPAETPFVVADSGDLHGANGEVLPSFLVLSPPGTKRATQLSLAATDRQQIALSLVPHDTALVVQEQRASNERSRGRHYRSQPRKETNPLVLAFNSMTRAVKLLVGDAPSSKKRATTKRL